VATPAGLEQQHTLPPPSPATTNCACATSSHRAPTTRPQKSSPGPGPLSRQEALELLALSEVIARKAAYGRQLTVRSTRAAGAPWTQIGAALSTTRQSAWEAHSRRIDQQAGQRSAYGHPSMDSQHAAAARALAGKPRQRSAAVDRCAWQPAPSRSRA
jgi:hypothetical protein